MSCLTRVFHVNNIKGLKGTLSGLSRRLNTYTYRNDIPKITLTENPWIYRENTYIKSPPTNSRSQNKVFDLPGGLQWVVPVTVPAIENYKIIEAPADPTADVSKEAARLIVIRRKKMKKHKLKKLRKKMKFEWAKRRQRRELRKEKAFQAVLIQQCKEAESFAAEQYVQERLQKLKEVSMPKQVNPFSRTT